MTGWRSWSRFIGQIVVSIAALPLIYWLVSGEQAINRAALAALGFGGGALAFLGIFVVSFLIAPYQVFKEQKVRIDELEGWDKQRNEKLAAVLGEKVFEGQALLVAAEGVRSGEEGIWLGKYARWCSKTADLMRDQSPPEEIFMFQTISPDQTSDLKVGKASLSARLVKLRMITSRYMATPHAANPAISSSDQT